MYLPPSGRSVDGHRVFNYSLYNAHARAAKQAWALQAP
jgi:hypothetical protein